LLAAGILFTAFSPPVGVSAARPQQAAYGNKLDSFFATQMAAYKIPGLAVAIVRYGQVEYLKGYGVANSNGDPVTPETSFLLASVSKTFTALGVMQLVEAGKISLDDPVKKHLPWFTIVGEGGETITVAHLVYHTSGFSQRVGEEMNELPIAPDGLEAGVRGLSGQKLNFSPGNGWEYSNANYSTLGLLIQEVSGQRFEDYIQQNIFDPLGMKNSYTSLADARARNAASGYYPFFGIPLVYDESMPYATATLPTGGLWSSAADMSRYLLAHLNGGRYQSATLLSAAGVETLHTLGREIFPGYNYAMGWYHAPGFLDREFLNTLSTDLKQYEDVETLWHEGEWLNYRSIALMLPELDYGVVVLMNINDRTVASAYKDIAWDVTLIATGGEAYYFPPSEDFIVRYSLWIFSGVAVFLLGGLLWSLSRQNNSWRTLIPLPVNLGLLAYLHLNLLPENDVNIPILLRGAPDLGILVSLVTLLAVGWSITSLLLFLKSRSK
jgi:CubicO group peptidase (beta-lactamase class C family)